MLVVLHISRFQIIFITNLNTSMKSKHFNDRIRKCFVEIKSNHFTGRILFVYEINLSLILIKCIIKKASI